jgi:hypothetical protein
MLNAQEARGQALLMVDVLFLCGILILPFVRTPVRITSPFGYICFFLGLTFIGKYAYNQFWGTPFLLGLDMEEVHKSFQPMAAYLCVAFAAALPFCGDRLFGHPATRTSHGGNEYIVRQAEVEPTLAAKALLIVVPSVLLLIGAMQGINPVANPLGFRQLIQSKGMFYILSIYLFLLAVISIYVPYIFLVLRKRPSIGVIILYLWAAAFAIISGFASMIQQLVIVPLFFWSVCYRKRIELWVAFLLPAIITFTLFYSAYRDANFLGSRINLSEAMHAVIDNPDAVKIAMNRFDYLETYVEGHRYVSDLDPDWGASMLGVFLQPLPRGFWPDKPEAFSTYMTGQILPQNLQIGVTANFNSLNEFTKAFGSAGVAIGGLSLACILVLAYSVFSSAVGRPYLSTYYVTVVLIYVSSGFMGGFVDDQALPQFILNNIYFFLFVRRPALTS